ncbi:POU domain class 2-associating factor 1 isoform X3 [Osmerus mordax]|uniref:POU domain class 2-associating factor 1 isoform X3 n=1 Tax=Osmerus mordax TaxID=8014 RepID=UPI00350F4B6E
MILRGRRYGLQGCALCLISRRSSRLCVFAVCSPAPPAGQASARPYQGVRVRDPVKELLRKKRGLDPHSTWTAPPAAGPATVISLPSYSQVYQVGFDAVGCPPSPSTPPAGSEGGGQCAGWVAPSPEPPRASWPCPDYHQQNDLMTSCTTFTPTTFSTATFTPSTLSYPSGPAMAGEVYMQSVCPSYTVLAPPSVLTYTHAPLFTNFGTIPVSSGSPHFPQVELQDVAYIPWAQPFASLPSVPTQASIPTLPTLSNLHSTGVQFAACSATLPGTLLPMALPLSSLPQTNPQTEGRHAPQTLEEALAEALEVDPGPDQQPEPMNPLEMLLEEQVEADEEKEEEEVEEQEEGRETFRPLLFTSVI